MTRMYSVNRTACALCGAVLLALCAASTGHGQGMLKPKTVPASAPKMSVVPSAPKHSGKKPNKTATRVKPMGIAKAKTKATLSLKKNTVPAKMPKTHLTHTNTKSTPPSPRPKTR